MSWLRDGDGSAADGNGLGVTSITERYVVVGQVEPAAVVSDPTAYIGGMAGSTAPLPDYGSVHPVYPGLRLRTWSAQSSNANVFAVATYNNATAIFEPEWFSRSGGYQTETFTFPYARRIRHTIPTAGGTTPVDQDLWKIETVSVRQTVRRNEINVNVGGAIGDAVEAMDLQNNKIHIINGRAYRFEAGSFYETRPNTWIVNYAWIYESGIYWNDTLQSDGDLQFPDAVDGLDTSPIGGTVFVAPPFYAVDAIPQPAGPEFPPTFRRRLEYPIEEDGYLTLVGLPPL